MMNRSDTTREHHAPASSRAGDHAETAGSMTWRDLLLFLFKRLRLMAFVVVLVTAVAATLVYVIPPVYSSQAMLLVEYGRKPTLRSEPTEWPLQISELIETERQMLMSRSVSAAVVDALDLAREPTQTSALRQAVDGARQWLVGLGLQPEIDRRNKIIGGVQSTLKVKQPPMTVLLELRYGDEDPAQAQRILSHLIEAYLEQRRSVYQDDKMVVFFRQRIAELDRELEAVRTELARQTDLAATGRLELQLKALEAAYLASRERLDRAEADAEADPSLVNVRVVDSPNLPTRPRYSRLALIILAFVAGVLLATGLALLLEFFDAAVYRPDDLPDDLDIPVVASIRHSFWAGWAVRLKRPVGGEAPPADTTASP